MTVRAVIPRPAEDRRSAPIILPTTTRCGLRPVHRVADPPGSHRLAHHRPWRLLPADRIDAGTKLLLLEARVPVASPRRLCDLGAAYGPIAASWRCGTPRRDGVGGRCQPASPGSLRAERRSARTRQHRRGRTRRRRSRAPLRRHLVQPSHPDGQIRRSTPCWRMARTTGARTGRPPWSWPATWVPTRSPASSSTTGSPSIDAFAVRLPPPRSGLTPMSTLSSTELKRLHRSWRKRALPRLAIILDGVAGPFNVGGLVRTAAAYRADAVWTVPPTPPLDDPKVGRTAMGTDRFLDLVRSRRRSHRRELARDRRLRVVAVELAHEAVPAHEVGPRRRRLPGARPRGPRPVGRTLPPATG